MKLIFSVVFVIFISVVVADEWADYKKRYKLSFKKHEDYGRLENFKHNMRRLSEHNLNPEKSYKMATNAFFHMKFDEFSKIHCKTLLPSRLKQLARQRRKSSSNSRQFITRKTTPRSTTAKRSTSTRRPVLTTRSTITKTSITTTKKIAPTTIKPLNYPFGNFNSENAPPSSMDFQALLQPIQDQKACGSCWAFAVMAQQGGLLKML